MATFKSKMKYLDKDWADRIWSEACRINDGKGAGWKAAAAVLAITGARPASLARGIILKYVKDLQGNLFIEATIPGAKIIKKPDGTAHRGQDEVKMNWRISGDAETPPRSKEFRFLAKLMAENPKEPLVLTYGTDAISSAIKDASQRLWPRRKHHVTAICYREMFSTNAKDAGVDPAQLAMAMGHLSSESQGKYGSRNRKAGGGVQPKKLFSAVSATTKVKTHRSPMARLKAFKSLQNKVIKKTTTMPMPRPR